MKLKECLRFGVECGMDTLGKAYLNVDYHALSIFKYSEIEKEMNELTSEYNYYYDLGLMDSKSSIEDCMKILEEKSK